MNFSNFQPNLKVLRLVAEIDEFKGSWRSLSNISPDRLAGLKRVATIESIGSSTRIEGATLTDAQVESLLFGIRKKSFRSRGEQEVAGYAETMDAVFANWQAIPLTENFVKQLHRDLLKHSPKDSRHRGNFKTISNNVEAFGPNGESLGIVFKTTSPFDTPFKMTELLDWTNKAFDEGAVHPLLITAVFAVVFLAIHPFQDGNGRLSRILTTLLLLKAGYAYVAYSSLESVIETNKEHYYLALRRTQTSLDSSKPDWMPWIQFFLESMQVQKAKLQVKIAREQLFEGDLPPLSIQIMKLITEHGRVKISFIESATGEHRSTIKLRLNELIGSGRIERHGRGPATWYIAARAAF